MNKNKKKKDFIRSANNNKILLLKITWTSYLLIFYLITVIKTSIFYLFQMEVKNGYF